MTSLPQWCQRMFPAPGGRSSRKHTSSRILSEGKRWVYIVGVLVSLIPLVLPFTAVAEGEMRASAASIIAHVPALAIAFSLLVCLIRRKLLHLVETVLWVSCAAFALWWDIVGLGGVYSLNYVGAGRHSLMIIACFLIALSVPAPRAWVFMGTFYTVHMALLWVRILKEPWSEAHGYHLVDSSLSTLIMLLVASVPLYQAAVNASNTAADSHQLEASTDHLTQLPNRRWLMSYLEQQPATCVALLDLDDFKKINDTLGHAAGDEVLKSAAQALNDAVGDQGVVGRWGGEEFLIVFTESNLAESVSAVERALTAVKSAQSPKSITCSAGVAELGANQSLDAALSQADKYLYLRKRYGKDGLCSALTDDVRHPREHVHVSKDPVILPRQPNGTDCTSKSAPTSE